MTTAPMIDRISLRVMGGASLVTVVGDLDLDALPELREALLAGLEVNTSVIVDLSRADTVESLALSTLLTANRVARRAGGDLLLAGPSRFVRDVLRASRLDTAFSIYPTVPAAMSAARVARA